MVLDGEESLIERIESEIETSKQLFSVRIDELSDEEKKYEDVLQSLLEEVGRGLLPTSSLTSYFERAKGAVGSNKMSVCVSIKSEIREEKEKLLNDQSKKVKNRVQDISDPVADIMQKIMRLESEFEQQKKILHGLEVELSPFKEAVERQMSLPRPYPLITELRRDRLKKKQKEIEPKIEEASSKLGEIAQRLWDANLEYNIKSARYALSVIYNQERLEKLLTEWSETIERSEKFGFLSHCSEPFSRILLDLWSRIKTFISNCKNRVLPTEVKEERAQLAEILNDAELWQTQTPEFDNNPPDSNKMRL